jgi:Fe-S-cluster containining protein
VGEIKPEMAKEDGSCLHLTEDNLCAIYETRPKYCRVDESLPKGWHPVRWQMFNASMCNQMQEEDGLPEKFRLKVVME